MQDEPDRDQVPIPPTPKISALMRRFKSADTLPEVRVRSALHGQGLRFRIQVPVPELPRRRIDIAFPRQKVAVFIDGCFWHSCPDHGKIPARNGEWWAEKLRKNAHRDMTTNEALMHEGWTVVRAWEHQDAAEVAELVARVVRAR